MEGNSHLICIIHGVGKHDSKKREKYLQILRQNTLKLLDKIAGSDQNVEFVFTEWHSQMSEVRESLIKDISVPQGAQLLKTVMKDVVSDGLFYAEPAHKERIISSVIEQINAAHTVFAFKNPESSKNLHILAHSLGGVIAYDLLCGHYCLDQQSNPEKETATSRKACHQLAEDPKNLFICGSPLGLFLSIRGNLSLIQPTTGNLGKTRCWNALHPMDPLAYRLEPLLDLKGLGGQDGSVGGNRYWDSRPPIELAYWKGRKHTHQRIGMFARAVADRISNFRKGSKGGPSQAATAGALSRENSGTLIADSSPLSPAASAASEEDAPSSVPVGHPQQAAPSNSRPTSGEMTIARVDHMLQQTFNESLSDIVTSIRSHRCYWHSLDLLLFMLKCVCKGQAGEDAAADFSQLSDEDDIGMASEVDWDLV